jgi:hypothetical protein
MSHLFISHSTKDGADFARQLVEALEVVGLRCWVAPRDVKAGTDYPAQIVSAIRESRGLVLVLTAEANASPGVIREVELADKQGKQMVPLLVGGTRPSDGLTYFLSIRQQIPWTGAATAAAALVELFGTTPRPSTDSDAEQQGRAVAAGEDDRRQAEMRRQAQMRAMSEAAIRDMNKTGGVVLAVFAVIAFICGLIYLLMWAATQ